MQLIPTHGVIKKLQFRCGNGLQEVLSEWQALKVRDHLLELAHEDDAKGESQEEFVREVSHHQALLGQARCHAVLDKSAVRSLGPFQYWHEPLPEHCASITNNFGLAWKDNKLCCRPLQRDAVGAARWSDYTGRPGFVSQDVWQWRLWAVARGGFQLLRRPEQEMLESVEAIADPSFLRVTGLVECRLLL